MLPLMLPVLHLMTSGQVHSADYASDATHAVYVCNTKGLLYSLHAADENNMLSLPPQPWLHGLASSALMVSCCELVKHAASIHCLRARQDRSVWIGKVFSYLTMIRQHEQPTCC